MTSSSEALSGRRIAGYELNIDIGTRIGQDFADLPADERLAPDDRHRREAIQPGAPVAPTPVPAEAGAG